MQTDIQVGFISNLIKYILSFNNDSVPPTQALNIIIFTWAETRDFEIIPILRSYMKHIM